MSPGATHDLEAEACVLGAVMIDPRALDRAREYVTAGDFYDARHRAVFQAAEDVIAEGSDLDIVLVRHRLGGAIEGASELLADLVQKVPTSVEVTRHARLVLDLSIQRQSADLCRAVQSRIGNRGFTGSDAVAELTQGLYDLSLRAQRGPQRVDIGKTLMRVMEDATSANSNPTQLLGYPPLDQLVHGFVRSSLVTIAARPGCGKTTFALDCFRHFVLAGGKAGFVSLEMPADQVLSIVLSAESRVDHAKYLRGQLSAQDLDENLAACNRIYPHVSDMVIETPRDRDFSAVVASVRRMVEEGCKIVFIDYLQLIRYPAAESRRLEVSYITGALKALALETGVIIVQLAQLNREVESSPGREPRMSDLKESGSIEEDSDYCIFPHLTNSSEKVALVRIMCLKNRHGPTGGVGVKWLKGTRSFVIPASFDAAQAAFAREFGIDERDDSQRPSYARQH